MNTVIYLATIIILLQGIQLNNLEIPLLSFFDELVIVIMFILSLIKIIKQKTISKTSIKMLFGTAIFWFIGIISCIVNSQYNISDLIVSSFLAVKFWLVVFSITNLKISEQIKKTIIKAILFVEKIAIVLAIINIILPNVYFSFFTFEEEYYRFGMRAVTSCFNHPSTFGWFMLLCAIIHLSLYKFKNDSKEKIYVIISVIFAILSLRTKIIISIMGCFIFYVLFMNRKNLKAIIKGMLIAILLSSVLLFCFKDIVINTYNLYFKGEQGMTARQALNIGSEKIMKEYFPIGVGFGKYGTWYAAVNYSEYYSKYGMSNIYGLTKGDPKYSTDTFWPAIMGETGALGFLIYVALVIYCFRCLLKTFRSKVKSNNIESALSTIALLIFILTIIESFGEASFNSSPKNIITAMFIGMALNLNKSIKSGESV